ncbi:hypothetical protein ACFQJ7_11620 [Halovenus rubra]|uniref:Uncharacterized protein n=2 Tax=Halovenus rubra TaxID=869890 RepID=A0ACC7E476_9EURY|nr:hypothetical protein [Halovenus rubra]
MQYAKGEPADIDSTWDPLEVTVLLFPNTHYDNIESMYVYSVNVRLLSNLWVVDPTPDNLNQKYLADFLETVADQLPVKQVRREIHGSADFWFDFGIPEYASHFDPEEIF